MTIKYEYELSRQPTVEDVIDSPFFTGWLKEAVEVSILRDPLKAMREVEVLHAILKKRHEDLLKLKGC